MKRQPGNVHFSVSSSTPTSSPGSARAAGSKRPWPTASTVSTSAMQIAVRRRLPTATPAYGVVVVGGGAVASRGPVEATGKREQSTDAAATPASTAFVGSYDGFGVPSAHNSPDCQPPRPTSSRNWKLKNAPTAG